MNRESGSDDTDKVVQQMTADGDARDSFRMKDW